MVGIELVADRATRQPFDPRARVGAEVCRRMRRHGVIVRPLGDVIVLVPPLVIEETALALLVEAARTEIEAIGEAAASSGDEASVVHPAGDA
jgi:adenosylmethionine-8-amino-7-oxononanoate aminotransferase